MKELQIGTGEFVSRRHSLDNNQTARDEVVNILLSSPIIRPDFFANDCDDEFRINRETGESQGIFKVWAPHIIPILDGFTSAEEWSKSLKNNPLKLHESLEQWRAFSSVFDRRLQLTFADRKIPENTEAAAVELFLRLNASFTFSAPFYNVEALVADSREIRIGNPINVTETSLGGGNLDAVALLLPSVLADQLTAKRLDWSNTTWDEIKHRINRMRESFLNGEKNSMSDQFNIISKVAGLAGTGLEEVLFAANALQFIPVSVGGKVGDIAQDQATLSLLNILNTPVLETQTSIVAKDINGLLRFLNWFPAVKSPSNFQGEFWTYDAVCATANKLLKIIIDNPSKFFDSQFADIFVEQLIPQLEGIDATSAKGRFLLQLLLENKFKGDLVSKINDQSVTFMDELLISLETIKQQEHLVDISQQMPTFLVGGKADGIRRAMQIFGNETVLGGKVLTSEAVGGWLETINGIGPLLLLLNSDISINQKIETGKKITSLINDTRIPLERVNQIKHAMVNTQRIVLRSSSFDEDVPIIGPAPGIYESAININLNNDEDIANALKVVVSSFFSEKAISFRELKGLQNRPIFAVLIQEFIDNVGGSIFINKGDIQMNIAQQPSAINVPGARFHDVLDGKLFNVENTSDLLSRKQTQKIISIAQKTEEIFGPVDIEFVVEPRSNRVLILQLRSLRQLSAQINTINIGDTEIFSIDGDNLENLPDIGNGQISLRISTEVNLEKFQGTLFRWIVRNGQKIKSIILDKRIPTTCHFANIVGCFGIELKFSELANKNQLLQ